MTLCETLASAFRDALDELDPARLVREALPPLPPKRARVEAIAIGKASSAMLAGALDRWGERIDHAVTIGVRAIETTDRVAGYRAAHPIPDAASVIAAEAALERARSLGPGDLLLALISGGASSLASLPPVGVSLDRKRRLVAMLLEGGASIHEVNLVRRHVSLIKGGRLGLAANGARVLTLVVSDVIRGEAHEVGSGPTVPDPTTIEEAVRVLARWSPDDLALLGESPKPGSFRSRASILASPELLASAVARALERRGFRACVDPPDDDDAASVVARRLRTAATLSSGEAVVIACEPTIALPPSRGQGGRAGWIALACARDLPPGVALLCGASDGADGSSGAAGACITREAVADLPRDQLLRALETFDDAPIHRALGTTLLLPEGHNLADLHIVARSSDHD